MITNNGKRNRYLSRDGCSLEMAEKICTLIRTDPNARVVFEAMKRGTLFLPAMRGQRRSKSVHARKKMELIKVI